MDGINEWDPDELNKRVNNAAAIVEQAVFYAVSQSSSARMVSTVDGLLAAYRTGKGNPSLIAGLAIFGLAGIWNTTRGGDAAVFETGTDEQRAVRLKQLIALLPVIENGLDASGLHAAAELAHRAHLFATGQDSDASAGQNTT